MAPIESVFVEPDDGPVDRKSVRSIGGDTNGVGVEDRADGALLRVSYELRNLAVKAVQLFHIPRRLNHILLGLQERCGDCLGISPAFGLLPLQPTNLLLRRSVDFVEGAYSRHNIGGGVLVGLAAKGDDLLAMPVAIQVR